MMKTLLSPSLWTATFLLMIGAQANAGVKLNVSPNVCVKEPRQSHCQLDLTVQVQSTSPQALCLVIPTESEQRLCRKTTQHWETLIQVNARDNFSVEIIDELNDAVLARKGIRVLEHTPDAQRIKRRFGWGF
ncbi:hypothetical protein HMF8227_01063 [Saliniradius amylolyticus]|uniref:DUF3019 domain-containing protein n=1 Tax=Saliniradius amylolyticus TaxID=2183582 RepID=A0A2S2E2R5_9ALTE|nr:hypothetical protein HMF8227_01063 [Saliniradius amylolyticus]